MSGDLRQRRGAGCDLSGGERDLYVPSYNPTVVYGAAPEYYPYPSIAYPTGAVVAAGAISFGLGVAVGAIFNGCCGGGWPLHPIS